MALGAGGDLASRLKGKGLDLSFTAPVLGAATPAALAPSSFPAARAPAKGAAGARAGNPKAAAPPAPSHAPLASTSSVRKNLFTPLMGQGSKAIVAESKLKAETELDILDGVRGTLRRWVQECLAREEKRQKLVEKGALKCRITVRWSENIEFMLRKLVGSFGGKLAKDSDKENNGGDTPAWLLKNEKWFVSLDAAALEAFMDAFPEVVEPEDAKVRAFVAEFCGKADPDTIKIRDLFTAMEGHFGPLRRCLLDRAKRMAVALLVPAGRGTKRKAPGDARGQQDRPGPPSIEGAEDAAWAASVLAPLGLQADGGAPVAQAPAAVAEPILGGLRRLQELPDFREALRTSQIGKIVNSYRHHRSAKVAQVAKELVGLWKAAATARAPPS